jgi:hypothetical protein
MRQARRALQPLIRLDAGTAIVVGAVGFSAALGTVGADARWLVALGRTIANDWSIPDGVPFATAPSDHWHNVPVAAELLLDGLYGLLGEHGLLLGQLAAVTIALAAVRRDALREGTRSDAVACTLAIAVIAALPALLVVRSQLFSLALFPIVVALLRTEARKPSGRIWLVVPFFAVWSNLHGAVLIAVLVLFAYLALARMRIAPFTSVGVFCASLLALCATPALADTPRYYRGVLENEAARRGYGLWEPLSPTAPFDILLILCGLALLALAFRARPALWEAVVLIGLSLLTVRAARTGVWLVLFSVVPAARGLRDFAGFARVARPIAFLGAALAIFGLVRGPLPLGASRSLIDRALAIADGEPVLADATYGEQVVLAGGRIWMGNPLDAFSHPDQRAYLDWLQGKPEGDAVFARAGPAVLVRWESEAQRRLTSSDSARLVERDDDVALYALRR